MAEYASRAQPALFEENPLSGVRRVVGVASGKGGVGKSLVSAALACGLARQGCSVGILDADITGPSIPRMLGLAHAHLTSIGNLLLPEVAPGGIKVMSANLLVGAEEEPILWRGPMLAGAIRQFWSDTSWGPLDYLVVDLPPGTGDVTLTVYQSLPLDGVIVVASPQDLVAMIVAKAIAMASRMGVGVLGLVENLAYLDCPHCGQRIHPFGEPDCERIAARFDTSALDELPIDSALAAAADQGRLAEALPDGFLRLTVDRVLDLEHHPAHVPSPAPRATPGPVGGDVVDVTPEEI